ncbi:MAG: Holliday junction branch migration protein RuvA [Candidatus Aerophobetes bacterium]|nr:Holliday junction branch migration protein RuvA [Candidatus Aerophobetes bacterium]
MFYYLKGVLQHKSPGLVLIEVGGVGYRVNLPLSSYENLPEEGKEIKVYTYLHLQENKVSLYGFLAEEERDFFLLLISISKIGPKKALRILSKNSLSEFKKAIKEKDLTTLTNISGIGKKTAQLLILELGEKIVLEEKEKSVEETLTEDALAGLVSLGYTHKEAKRAVRQASSSCKEKADLAQLIKEALRYI